MLDLLFPSFHIDNLLESSEYLLSSNSYQPPIAFDIHGSGFNS